MTKKYKIRYLESREKLLVKQTPMSNHYECFIEGLGNCTYKTKKEADTSAELINLAANKEIAVIEEVL